MCARIVLNKQQLNDPMLITRTQWSNLSTKFNKWHMLNRSSSITSWNIKSSNYCRKLGMRQPVAEWYREKNITEMNTPAHDKTLELQTLIVNNWVQFEISLSDGKTEPTCWSYADMKHITDPAKRMMWSITSNKQKRLNSNYPFPWSSFQLSGRQSTWRSNSEPSNSLYYISDFLWFILWVIFQRQFSELI